MQDPLCCPAHWKWASPLFLWPQRSLFTSFSRNKRFWIHRALLTLTLHSHPPYPCCTLTLSKPRPNPTQGLLVAVRFYLIAHPSHREPRAKILPSTGFGYSVLSLQFLTTPQASKCPCLYLYFPGNAAVCIFQSGCCCHSSLSGHCQKLQAMDSPKTSEEAEQRFF